MIFGNGLWSAEESFVLHMRKGGRKEKTSTRGDPDDLINYLFWKEKELGLRTYAVLKNYIGIIEGHTHFLLVYISMYIFGTWLVNIFRINAGV